MIKIELDMELPYSCTRCPFYVGMNYGKCVIDEASFTRHCQDMRDYEYDRPDWCPLKEE